MLSYRKPSIYADATLSLHENIQKQHQIDRVYIHVFIQYTHTETTYGICDRHSFTCKFK